MNAETTGSSRPVILFTEDTGKVRCSMASILEASFRYCLHIEVFSYKGAVEKCVFNKDVRAGSKLPC